MKRMSVMGILALAAAVSLCGSAGAAILSDDFNDDAGVLTGQSANTGQTWEEIPGRAPLDMGAQFGQGDVGAGNDNAGGSGVWGANRVALGQIVNDGTIVISADFRKQHIAGPINEMSLSLKSSTQGGKETALIWAADWLKIGGSWTYGGGQINTGVPADIHAQMTMHMIDGGANQVEISFEEIGNPANNGSLMLPGSIEGTLNYDTLEIWATTRNGKIVGFDNLNVVPEPATLALLGVAAVALARRRRNMA